MDSYRTIAEPVCTEYVEKRSRFLARLAPVQTQEEAAALIADIKTHHWDASHNCSAYILRAGGIQRCSDDGEPQGTAGTPMLEVLKKETLTDIAVVVTRYFGGILLGAGGLVRAYSHCVKLAIDAAKLVDMRLCDVFSLQMDYSDYRRVEALLHSFTAQLLDTDFGENVKLRARLESGSFPGFCAALAERTAGKLTPLPLAQEYAACPVSNS